MEKYDLLNKKFNCWTAIKETDKRRGDGSVVWLCMCDCGVVGEIPATSLINGKTKSCGCIRKSRKGRHYNWQGYEEISRSYWKSIEKKAILRNYRFEITMEYMWQLYLQQNRKCALSGLDIEFNIGDKDTRKHSASIDRIDSQQGYIVGNVQWVHKDINKMKQNFPEDKFINYCGIIYNKNRGKLNE